MYLKYTFFFPKRNSIKLFLALINHHVRLFFKEPSNFPVTLKCMLKWNYNKQDLAQLEMK